MNRLRIALHLGLSIAVAVSLTTFGDDLLIDSGQRLGDGATWQVGLGDVDGDGDLDAVTANEDIGGAVWLNDGAGVFADSGQRLSIGNAIAVADLDHDGAPDIVLGSWSGLLVVWWNDGAGAFTQGPTLMADSGCLGLGAGDLDGDGDLEIFVGRAEADRLFVNAGGRTYVDSGGRFGSTPTGGVAFGDVDGDGDIDILAAGWDESGHVWLNDGAGGLASGAALDVAALHVHGAVLADYEGDGDLDAFFALAGGICCRNVWVSDGTGGFTPQGFDFGSSTMHAVAVGDVDLDGHPDVALAVGARYAGSSNLWLGADGGFVNSGLRIGDAYSGGLALGDLDGDGDLDLFIGFLGYRPYPTPNEPHPNEVWMNTTIDSSVDERSE